MSSLPSATASGGNRGTHCPLYQMLAAHDMHAHIDIILTHIVVP